MISFIYSILFCAFSLVPDKAELNRTEALNAFHYLNKVRQEPSAYSKEIKINFSKIKTTHKLRWNDTLAKVAEAKALDMANKNYFDHTDKKGEGINIQIYRAGYSLPADWIKPKNQNFFESIGAGYKDGIELIQGLIEDQGVYPPGHREHMLSITDFNKNMYEIGIGFATIKSTKNEYTTYASIIIAKHNF